MLIEAILFIVFLFLVLTYTGKRSKDLPPGPMAFPIVGNLIQIAMRSKQPYIAFDKLAEEYGDFYTLRMGSVYVVVLASYKAIQETLGKDSWSGRPWGDFWEKRYLNQRIGLIFLAGEPWKEQRRFVLRHLRDFGFGKQTKMEEIIHEELDELMSRLKQSMKGGQQGVIHIDTYFNLSVLNVLWTMMGGIRYSHDDKKLSSLIEKTNMLLKSQKAANPSLIFPILRKLFPEYFQETKEVANYNSLHNFFKEAIKQHRNDPSFGNSAHFIDVFLQEVDKTVGEGQTSFTDDQLVALCTDFFMAGSETTSNTLSFGILYMMIHPEIQQKVYEEIIGVVGLDGRLSLDHRPKLPYTEAVLLETQRLACIAPLTPPHQTMEDVTYRGYKIPKNTVVFVNLYSLNKNKEHWNDPEIFRPERFLNEDGLVVKDEQLIPFGLGKRVCPGESLAKMSLFLYFTTLVKHFKFETVPGQENPSMEPIPGLTLSPQPFSVQVTTR